METRTRDFADGFAESLEVADEILLMDIYPARELPMEGIASGIIFDRIQNPNKRIVKDDELLDTISNMNVEVLLTIGAGNIDQFVEPIKEVLARKI